MILLELDWFFRVVHVGPWYRLVQELTIDYFNKTLQFYENNKLLFPIGIYNENQSERMNTRTKVYKGPT